MPGVRLNFFSFDVQIDFLIAKANRLAVVAEGDLFAAQNAAVKVDRFWTSATVRTKWSSEARKGIEKFLRGYGKAQTLPQLGGLAARPAPRFYLVLDAQRLPHLFQ